MCRAGRTARNVQAWPGREGAPGWHRRTFSQPSQPTNSPAAWHQDPGRISFCPFWYEKRCPSIFSYWSVPVSICWSSALGTTGKLFQVIARHCTKENKKKKFHLSYNFCECFFKNKIFSTLHFMNILHKSVWHKNSSFYTITFQMEHTRRNKTKFPVPEQSPTLTNN